MNQYDIVDISTSFNRTVKQLLLLMSQSITNNLFFESVKRKIKIIIDKDPLYLLEEGGKYLFNYREFIKNDDFDNLIFNTDNLIKNEDKELLIKEAEKITTDTVNNIKNILYILRDKWASYIENDDDTDEIKLKKMSEKNMIKRIIKTLLSEYCKYLTIK
jgi:hypothetical protein